MEEVFLAKNNKAGTNVIDAINRVPSVKILKFRYGRFVRWIRDRSSCYDIGVTLSTGAKVV